MKQTEQLGICIKSRGRHTIISRIPGGPSPLNQLVIHLYTDNGLVLDDSYNKISINIKNGDTLDMERLYHRTK